MTEFHARNLMCIRTAGSLIYHSLTYSAKICVVCAEAMILALIAPLFLLETSPSTHVASAEEKMLALDAMASSLTHPK